MASTQAPAFLLLLSLANLYDTAPSSQRAWFKVQGDNWAREGRKSLTWSCILKGPASPAMASPSSYQWFKDGKVIPGKTDQFLTLTHVTRQDAGHYLCGPPGSSVERKGLDLHVRVTGDPIPRPVIVPQTHPILGRPFSLNCFILSNYTVGDDTAFCWHKDSAEIMGQSNQRLDFPNVTEADEGKYTCTAREGPDTSPPSPEYSLTIVVAPQVRIEPLGPVVRGILGENLTLTCEVTRAVPKVPADGYSWSYLPLHRVTEQPLAEKTRTLTLGPLTMEDRGQYLCQARNDQAFTQVNLTGHASVFVDIVSAEVEQARVTTPDTVQTADVAILNFSLPQMTSSIVVVHPAGHDIISVHQDCSLQVYPAFLSRCLQPRCDLERRHLTFTLTQVTEEDQGHYTCVEERTRARVPKCGTQLPFQRNELQPDHQNFTHVIIPVVLLFIVLVAGIPLAIKYHPQKRGLWNCLKVLILKQTEIQHREMEFESLYKKGKVYTFPRIASHSFFEDGEAKPPQDVSEKEFQVKSLLRFTLQMFMSTNTEDLPSFLFHNICLNSEEDVKPEDVFLIIDRKIGVVVMITKCVKSWESFMDSSSFGEAVQRLLEAREKVRHKLQGLVGSCDVTAVLALPCLTQDQLDDVRNGTETLRSHPDVELLLGMDKTNYCQWMEGLRREKASKVWRSSSHGGDDPDTVYKMAASSFLTLADCGGPGESPHSPDPAQSWLLTPAQVEVRDSTARLLHVWGPPGSGKTTLLVHRARQWLAEGNALISSTGKQFDDVKLAHIEKVLKGKNTEKILHLCRTDEELDRTVKQLAGNHPEENMCIITDILCKGEMLRRILSIVKAKRNVKVWTTSEENLHAISSELSKEAFELGWESLQLPDCIRCTKDTVELVNLLRKDVYPPIPSCSLPHDPDIPAWRVVDHCLHPDGSATLSKCDRCKSEMSQALLSQVPWNDWIALYTGPDYVDFKPMDEALLHMGVPSLYCSDNYIRSDHAGAASKKDFQRFRELVDSGMDEDGKPAVHFLLAEDFKGMERKGVILVHFDERDNNPKQQSQADKDTRLEEHRRQWINAVSRSKGQVILLLLTPSSARSLLGLPEPIMAQRGDARQSASIQMEAKV